MGGEEIINLSRHLDAAVRYEHEVVGDPLELREDVGRQHDRDAIVGDRRHHRRHEVVAGERIEHRHRLVEHEELRPASQRQGQRDLGLLAARQLPRLAGQGDAEITEAMLGVALVETQIEVAGHVQQVSR